MNRHLSATTTELQALRELQVKRLTQVPAFRRGSLQRVWRKCGKPNCHCAKAGDPGHGPRWQWTRTAKEGTRGQVIPPDQLDQVRAELDAGSVFTQIVDDLIEANEAICRSKINPARSTPGPRPVGEKGGPKTKTS